LPDDIDAEVVWHFNLPSHALSQEEFTFVIRDAKGNAIVDEKDVLRFGVDADAEPGVEMEGGVSPGVPGMFRDAVPRFLKQSAVDVLDRYMALHAGETITIEIAGEKPIRRVIFGRLLRAPGASPVQVFPVDPPPSTQPANTPEIPGGRYAPGGPRGPGGGPLPERRPAPRFAPRGATSR
jgi:hypothetical protein